MASKKTFKVMWEAVRKRRRKSNLPGPENPATASSATPSEVAGKSSSSSLYSEMVLCISSLDVDVDAAIGQILIWICVLLYFIIDSVTHLAVNVAMSLPTATGSGTNAFGALLDHGDLQEIAQSTGNTAESISSNNDSSQFLPAARIHLDPNPTLLPVAASLTSVFSSSESSDGSANGWLQEIIDSL